MSANECGSSDHAGRSGRLATLVDAKQDQAAAFYQRYGFRPIAGKPRTSFLPLATAKDSAREKWAIGLLGAPIDRTVHLTRPHQRPVHAN